MHMCVSMYVYVHMCMYVCMYIRTDMAYIHISIHDTWHRVGSTLIVHNRIVRTKILSVKLMKTLH